MATYAIGDVQGCWETLQKLLTRVAFDPAVDRLVFVGDLVNRGPLSLEVLRFAASHEDSVETVLGNHDLHLLAVARGLVPQGRGDTLVDILAAPDRDSLLSWLVTQPFVLKRQGCTVVHAGLRPEWNAEDAARRGAELQTVLNGPRAEGLLMAMRAPPPAHQSASSATPATPATPADSASPAANADVDRLAADAAILTRVRMCDAAGAPQLDFNGSPQQAPEGWRPWFEAPERRSTADRIVFGHWAALGFQRRTGVLALDSGCVWGGSLTAYRFEDRRVFQEPNVDRMP